MARPKRGRQQTIEATLGRSPVKVSVRPKRTTGNAGAASSPDATPRQTRLKIVPGLIPHSTPRSSRAILIKDSSSSSSSESESESESEEEVAVAKKKKSKAADKKKKKKKKKTVVKDKGSSSSSGEQDKKAKRNGEKKTAQKVEEDLSEDERIPVPTLVHSSGTRKTRRPAVVDSNSTPTSASKKTPHRQAAADSSSSEEAEESDKVKVDSADEEEDMLPVRMGVGTPGGRARGGPTASPSSFSSSVEILKKSTRPIKQDIVSDDCEEEALVTPVSANRGARKRKIVFDDSDDEPLVSSPVKRRRLVKRGSSVPVVEQGEEPPRSSAARPSVRGSARKPKTQKEKARELLRRKRAGEVIDEEEEESSEGDEPQRALYDSDSDSGFVALQEFDDDEEDPLAPAAVAKKPKKAKKKKSRKSSSDEDSGGDTDLDDFVVEDDDGPLGAPAELLGIPLQFTSHSHKPIKDHFRDVVEWCVQYKINPGFADKKHDLYRMAWQKLDDEVGGLAQSKFISSAWKRDFIMALRARPEMVFTKDNTSSALDAQDCQACGRSNHPAHYRVQFMGSPYFKKFDNDRFLEPVEVDTSSSENDQDEEDEEEGDEDEDGNVIPKASTTFDCGSVCQANASTAHMLIHWKIGLLNYVVYELTQSGCMAPKELARREKMTPKKRHKVVDQIMEEWEQRGTIKSLYREFERNVDAARSSTTSGRYARGNRM